MADEEDDTIECVMTDPLKSDSITRFVKRSTILKMPNYAIQVNNEKKLLNLVGTIDQKHLDFLVKYIESGVSLDQLSESLTQARFTHDESAQIATLFWYAGLDAEKEVACKYAATQKNKK